MDAHHEYLFIVRPVEDPDLTAPGQVAVRAPEEVVGELVGRGCLEGHDPYALGVQSGHDVADRAVLARGVQRLQNQQDAVGLLGCESGLEVRESRDAVGEPGGSGLFVLHTVGAGGVALGKVERRGVLDPERRDQIVDAVSFVVGGGHVTPRVRRKAAALRRVSGPDPCDCQQRVGILGIGPDFQCALEGRECGFESRDIG